ncbi:hypothetical protein HAX54_021325 [Datura stramonium]|uniref:Uncharacterized protein n=1 Tax=Datura stramonium TaxID=4076 RepID=A0ABS8UUH2_DATST|nr:hypothetical protein [Datura stramonium]
MQLPFADGSPLSPERITFLPDFISFPCSRVTNNGIILTFFCSIMSISPYSHTCQASVYTNNTQVRFGLEGMEEYYSVFKEKPVIHAEAQFDAESFKTAFPDIYYQIGTRDWGPFTIPVDPYFLELVWEFYASYRARQQLLKHKGRTEVFPCLTSVWVLGQEVPVTPEVMNSLYRDEIIPQESGGQIKPIPIGSQLDCKRSTTMGYLQGPSFIGKQYDYIGHKNRKEAPSMKREKYTGNKTPPPPSASTHTVAAPLHTDEFHSSTPPDFLNIAQRDKIHESQLVQLAKAIPSMIQIAIKKVLQPAKDKLTSLCSTIDVLESEVGTLRQEMAALTAPPSTSHLTPYIPEVMPAEPEAPEVCRMIGGWDMKVI